MKMMGSSQHIVKKEHKLLENMASLLALQCLEKLPNGMLSAQLQEVRINDKFDHILHYLLFLFFFSFEKLYTDIPFISASQVAMT